MSKSTSKYIAGILAIVFITISGQTTHAAVSTNGGQQLDVPANAQQSSASLNWSGYVAGGTNTTNQYTSVTGTWTVPAVAASGTDSADATWVGIGGVSSRDLVQTGTQAIVQDGSVTYSAWIETLPGFSKTLSLPVHVGDSITATLTEESPGEWLVTIDNNTTNKHYSDTVAYNSSYSSAEWVEEMVTNSDGTFRPLDSFGTVTITNAAATVNGVSKNLSELAATPLQMLNRANQPLATASAVGSDTGGFSVTRSAAVAMPKVNTVMSIRRHRVYSTGTSYYSIAGIPFTISIIRM